MPYPTSNYSQENVLRDVHDSVNQRLRVDADITVGSITVNDIIIRDATNASNKLLVNADGTLDVNTIISHTNDSIKLGDGTNLITSTTIGPKHGLDVNVAGGIVSGNFTSSGLSTAMKNTVITVTDVPTKIPATALTGRNTIAIRIWGTEKVYIGDSTVNIIKGYPKFQNEEIFMDVKDNSAVEVYGICESGKTCEVRVMEIA